MQTDIYTKVMLTVIAVSLVVIAGRGEFSSRALAQFSAECGTSKHSPCYIATGTWPLEMRLGR